jgi:hypothetical protein
MATTGCFATMSCTTTASPRAVCTSVTKVAFLGVRSHAFRTSALVDATGVSVCCWPSPSPPSPPSSEPRRGRSSPRAPTLLSVPYHFRNFGPPSITSSISSKKPFFFALVTVEVLLVVLRLGAVGEDDGTTTDDDDVVVDVDHRTDRPDDRDDARDCLLIPKTPCPTAVELEMTCITADQFRQERTGWRAHDPHRSLTRATDEDVALLRGRGWTLEKKGA